MGINNHHSPCWVWTLLAAALLTHFVGVSAKAVLPGGTSYLGSLYELPGIPSQFRGKCDREVCDLRTHYCESGLSICQSCQDECSPEALEQFEIDGDVQVQRCNTVCGVYLEQRALEKALSLEELWPKLERNVQRDGEPSAHLDIIAVALSTLAVVLALCAIIFFIKWRRSEKRRKNRAKIWQETVKPGPGGDRKGRMQGDYRSLHLQQEDEEFPGVNSRNIELRFLETEHVSTNTLNPGEGDSGVNVNASQAATPTMDQRGMDEGGQGDQHSEQGVEEEQAQA